MRPERDDPGPERASPVTTAPARAEHRLSLIALIAGVALVALGGYTRGSGSGFGCADRWPLCDNGLLGGWLPRAEFHMIVEWSHRWLAALVGLLAVLTAAWIWRRGRTARLARWSSLAAVVVIGFQAWLGRQVVKGHLAADLVSIHLAVSMLVVALLAITVVSTRQPTSTHRDVAWVGWLAGGAAGSLLVLLTGSVVHNQYVPGWPLVFGTLFADLSTPTVAIHFFHRVAAGVMVAYLGFLVLSVRRRRRPRFERLAMDVGATLHLANVGLGGVHVLTRVQSSAVVAAHLALAAIVWVSLVMATTAATRSAEASIPEARLTEEGVR